MRKLMFVTPGFALPPQGGRDMLSHLHRQCLEALCGADFLQVELRSEPVRGARAAAGALGGYVDGLTPDSEADVLAAIAQGDVGTVWLNGSNLGRLAKAVKKARPDVEVLSFFHNVEARFFLGAFREYRSLHALGVLTANYVAERMAARFSDRRLVLSERESAALARLYGRGGTDLLPMALEDRFERGAADVSSPRDGDYLLFVGGAFYANEAGIAWFAEQVAPHVAIRTCVVGRGLEQARAVLERHPNVEVVGPVDRLQPWYLGAKAVIAPIFDGSGMKTKVAEALMYGKRVIGTSEAFSGYEGLAAEAGRICRDRDEFVTAIAGLERADPPRFDPALRALFDRHHSREAAQARIEEILARGGRQSGSLAGAA